MSGDPPPGRYSLRRRAAAAKSGEEARGGEAELQRLLTAAAGCRNLVVFSGSGLSAPSGMSTFSTKGGLYEKAARRFGLADGKRLFSYSFFEKQRLEALAFFADIYTEAVAAAPAAGHRALAGIAAAGCLRRHYTLNIDGLGEAVGMDTWHPDTNPNGVTVEMHGSVRQLVCPSCGHVVPLTAAAAARLRAREALPCGSCGHSPIRIRVMLYDDAEDDVITPDTVYEAMEDDMAVADMVLWVGISFEQSASTQYFRNVRGMVAEAGRLGEVRQVVVNPSDEALWNLLSACSNTGALDVLEVLLPADAVLPALAAQLAEGGPHAARLAAEAAAAAAAQAVASAAAAAAAAAASSRRSAAGAVRMSSRRQQQQQQLAASPQLRQGGPAPLQSCSSAAPSTLAAHLAAVERDAGKENPPRPSSAPPLSPSAAAAAAATTRPGVPHSGRTSARILARTAANGSADTATLPRAVRGAATAARQDAAVAAQQADTLLQQQEEQRRQLQHHQHQRLQQQQEGHFDVSQPPAKRQRLAASPESSTAGDGEAAAEDLPSADPHPLEAATASLPAVQDGTRNDVQSGEDHPKSEVLLGVLQQQETAGESVEPNQGQQGPEQDDATQTAAEFAQQQQQPAPDGLPGAESAQQQVTDVQQKPELALQQATAAAAHALEAAEVAIGASAGEAAAAQLPPTFEAGTCESPPLHTEQASSVEQEPGNRKQETSNGVGVASSSDVHRLPNASTGASDPEQKSVQETQNQPTQSAPEGQPQQSAADGEALSNGHPPVVEGARHISPSSAGTTVAAIKGLETKTVSAAAAGGAGMQSSEDGNADADNSMQGEDPIAPLSKGAQLLTPPHTPDVAELVPDHEQ